MELPRKIASRFLLPTLLAAGLVAGCNSSSPTAPPALREAPPVHYSGTVQLLGIEGAASDSRISCAFTRIRGLVGQAFDFDLSLGDLPLLIPPGGRWGSSLFGVRDLACRMGYVESGTGIAVSDVFDNCFAGLDTSVLDELAAQCVSSVDSLATFPESFSLPPALSNGASLQGTGRIDAYILLEADNGFSNARSDVALVVRFDLRRVG